MKTILYIKILIISIVISACGTTKFSADYDDLYYTAKKNKNTKQNNESVTENNLVNTTKSGYSENTSNSVVLNPYYREENTTSDVGIEYGNDVGLVNSYEETNELAGELEDQVVYTDDDDYDYNNIYKEPSLYNLENTSSDIDDDEVSYSDRINKFDDSNNSNSYYSDNFYSGWSSFLAPMFSVSMSFGGYHGAYNSYNPYYSNSYYGNPYGSYSPYGSSYPYNSYSSYNYGYYPTNNYNTVNTSTNYIEANKQIHQRRRSTNTLNNSGSRTRFSNNSNTKSLNTNNSNNNSRVRTSDSRNTTGNSSNVKRTVKYNTHTNSGNVNKRNSTNYNNNRSNNYNNNRSSNYKTNTNSTNRTNNYNRSSNTNSSSYKRSSNTNSSSYKRSSSNSSSSSTRTSTTRSSNSSKSSSSRTSSGRKR